MKNYLPLPKPVSPCTNDLINAYLAQGLVIKKCLHGESGGLTSMYKSIMHPAARKLALAKFN